MDAPSKKSSDRVAFTYEVEVYGALHTVLMPFVIGIIADLQGNHGERSPLLLEDRKFLEIDGDNFDDRMKQLQPSVLLPGFPHEEGAAPALHLSFDSLDDFSPVAIARRAKGLREPMQKRQLLAEMRDKLQANRDLALQIEALLASDLEPVITWLVWAEANLVSAGSGVALSSPQAVSTELLASIDLSSERAIELLRVIVTERGEGRLSADPQLLLALDQRVTKLDAWIAERINFIIHQPDFLRLEAAWRGIHYLVTHIDLSDEMRLRIFPASQAELTEDQAYTKQVLLKKCYEDEYGQFGGEPYGLIVVDYAFSQLPTDVALLACLAQVGAECSCPVIGGATANLLNCDDVSELSHKRRLDRLFDLPEYTEWRAFKLQPEACYAGLVMPRVLGRNLHLEAGDRPERFAYQETIDALETWPWINAVFPLAERIAQTYLSHGWLATVADPESGGRITDMPTRDFITDAGEFAFCCSTEMPFGQQLAAQLNGMGLIVLKHRAGRDEAGFDAMPSLYDKASERRPRSDTSDDLVMSMLFSHIIRVLRCYHRDHISSWRTGDEMLTSLNAWLQGYVVEEDGGPSPETPFGEARLEQDPYDAEEGLSRIRIWVRPEFQVESSPLLTRELRFP